MKKLTVLLVLAVVLVFTMGTSAQEFSAENMKFVGGVTYNTYDGTVTVDGTALPSIEQPEVEVGYGFFAGGQYWFDPQMAVELGYDMANSKVDGDDSSISGFYAKFVYKANMMFDIKGGLGSYSMKVDNPENTEGNGLGILIGGEYKYPINKEMSLVGTANYRMLEIDIDNTEVETLINMSGFSIGGGVCVKF